jgi:opacity protein-like surface antigen
MKKQFFTISIFLLFISLTVNAQKTAWGLTASVIYASNGELIEDATNVIDNKGDGGVGFNAGIYGNLNLGLVYIRPKLVYSQTSSSYNLNSGSSENFKLSSLDLPVLVGIKIIKPLSFVVGPAFQYIINSKMESVSFENIQNNITVGLNIGVSIIVSRITIDLLYDRSFTENEANFIDNNTNTEYTLDTRPQQFVVGLSYRFGKK